MLEHIDSVKAKLMRLVGQPVEIRAGDDCADDEGVYFSLWGTLEAPEGGYERYFVRIADTDLGTRGFGFHPQQVSEVCKQVYHWQINMKQRLNASGD